MTGKSLVPNGDGYYVPACPPSRREDQTLEDNRTDTATVAPPSPVRQFFGWRTLLGLAVAGVVIYIFLTEFDVGAAWIALSQVRWGYLVAALVIYYLSVPLRGGRWGVLLRSAGYDLPVGRLCLYYVMAWFLNAILPSRLGDLYRAYLPKREYDVPLAASVGVLFSEKVLDLAITAGLVLVSGSFYWTRLTGVAEISYLYWALGAIGVLVVAFVALVRLLPLLVVRLGGKWQTRLSLFHGGLFRDRRRLPAVFAQTVLIWGSEAIRLYLVCLALSVPVNLLIALFISQAALLLMAIPLSPAGLGIVELLMLKAFSFLDIEASLAGAVTIADRLISHWTLIAIGAIVFVAGSRLIGRRSTAAGQMT
ncbi:flippase-like domain-containing protein [candidate division GN15 bacterium]|nr:flippase-like domain-containing protein [candidate division GN15 bacterium]